MFIKKCTLGRDAEVKYTQKGDAVSSISLAYNYGRKGDDGKMPTQWIEASLWGKRAETTAQYLLKGTQIVAVVKDLHVETYPKKDGTDGHKLVGILDDFEFCGGKRDEQPSSSAEVKSNGYSPQGNPSKGFDDFESDIPF